MVLVVCCDERPTDLSIVYDITIRISDGREQRKRVQKEKPDNVYTIILL